MMMFWLIGEVVVLGGVINLLVVTIEVEIDGVSLKGLVFNTYLL